jgi:hypothetical protein
MKFIDMYTALYTILCWDDRWDDVQHLAVKGEKIPDKFRFQEKGLFMI